MSPHDGGIEHLNKMRGLAQAGQRLEERLERPGLAQPPKPFPNAVPRTELGGQRAPGYVMYREIVQRFQKLAIVVTGFTAFGSHRAKHFDSDLPILLRHSCQHNRPSRSRSSMNH